MGSYIQSLESKNKEGRSTKYPEGTVLAKVADEENDKSSENFIPAEFEARSKNVTYASHVLSLSNRPFFCFPHLRRFLKHAGRDLPDCMRVCLLNFNEL